MSRLRIGKFITASRFELGETALQGSIALPGQGLCPSSMLPFAGTVSKLRRFCPVADGRAYTVTGPSSLLGVDAGQRV